MIGPWFTAFAIVACVAAIAYGVLAETWARAEAPVEVPPQYEAELIGLDRQAIRRAYDAQVQVLFQQWMRDATGQPARAVRGVNLARKAYVASMTALDARVNKATQQ